MTYVFLRYKKLRVVSYWHLTCIHFIKTSCLMLFTLSPCPSYVFACRVFDEIFRFDHELVIRKKIEEKLIAGREVRLVDRHGILTV